MVVEVEGGNGGGARNNNDVFGVRASAPLNSLPSTPFPRPCRDTNGAHLSNSSLCSCRAASLNGVLVPSHSEQRV